MRAAALYIPGKAVPPGELGDGSLPGLQSGTVACVTAAVR